LNDDSIDGMIEKEIKYDIKVEDEEWEDVPERDDVPKHDVPKRDEPKRDVPNRDHLTLTSAGKVTLTSTTDIDKESSSSSPVEVAHSVVRDEATDAILSSIKDSVFLLWHVYIPQLVQLSKESVKSTESECAQMIKLIADAEHVIEVAKTVGINPDVLKRSRKRKG
jgi:hypothetical protein